MMVTNEPAVQQERVTADAAQTVDSAKNAPRTNSEIEIELVKKTKKNEPKTMPGLMLVDKEAFQADKDDAGSDKFIMKELWRS